MQIIAVLHEKLDLLWPREEDDEAGDEKVNVREEDPQTLMDRAVALRSDGDYEAARDLLVSVRGHFGDRAGFWLVLGDMHEELGEMQAAVESYKRAVTLAPMHELSSRSLFHALWDLGRAGDVDAEEQAIAEIRRFITLADSEWYDKIIAVLHEKLNLLWPKEEDDEAGGEKGNSEDDG